MKKFFSDFKAFIARGNIIDLAIAVIIGGAFGAIVTSLVNDIIMPVLGLLFGRMDLKGLVTVIKEATETAPAVTINWGIFIQSIIDFLLIALTIFIALRILITSKNNIEKLAKKQAEEEKSNETDAAAPAEEVSEVVAAIENSAEETKTENAAIKDLLTEIRDLLKKTED